MTEDVRQGDARRRSCVARQAQGGMPRSRRRLRRRGFTFVEIMVAALVLPIIMACAVSFLCFGSRSVERSQGLADATERALFVFSFVERELGTATRVVLPRPGGTSETLVYQDSYGLLKVLGPSTDRRSVLLKVAGVSRVFKVSPSSRDRLCIDELRFANSGDGRITVFLSTEAGRPGRDGGGLSLRSMFRLHR